jgi:hypothetical protein
VLLADDVAKRRGTVTAIQRWAGHCDRV